MVAGIRELKNNLSRYIRRIEAGERISITAHGRVVAELVPPASATSSREGRRSRFEELVAAGVIRPPIDAGDPTEGWPDIHLPAGTAAELIDSDRGEA
jgi:prevent-host-death family protein